MKQIFVTLLLIYATPCMGQNDSLDLFLSKSKAQTITKEEQANLEFKIAEIFFLKRKNIDSAIIHYKKAARTYQETNNTIQEARCYQRTAYMYTKMHNDQKVLDYSDKALKLCEKINFKKGIAITLGTKATVGTAEEQIKAYRQLIAISRKENFKTELAYALHNLGGMYIDTKQYDSSLYYYQSALNCEGAKKELKPFIHFNLGDVYDRLEDFKKAEQALLTSRQLFSALHDEAADSWVLSQLVKLHLKWKKEKPKQYQQRASKLNLSALLEKAQTHAETSKDIDFVLNQHEAYAAYYESIGNHKLAVRRLNDIITLKDSISQKEKIKATAKYAAQLKTADKEREIIRLNADKKIASATANRNKIIFVLILLGLLSSIYFIIKRIKYRNQKEQEERDKNFRSKLSSDLHDDVGTILTSLSMQSELLEMKASESNKNTVSKIAGMSRDATRRMRDTVWAIDSRKDNVMDLAYRMIDFADDILDPKGMDFQLEHNIEGRDNKISAELRQNIFLIFKEAITNAAKYSTGEFVSATLKKENDHLNLVITNPTESNINTTEVSGLGLSNIKKRSEEMNGVCTFESNKSNFQVKLSFPI